MTARGVDTIERVWLTLLLVLVIYMIFGIWSVGENQKAETVLTKQQLEQCRLDNEALAAFRKSAGWAGRFALWLDGGEP